MEDEPRAAEVALVDLGGAPRSVLEHKRCSNIPMPRHTRLSLASAIGVAAAALLLLLLQPRIAHARNPSPFSSNVVALTARNWKREVEDSPHGVFVNICRSG